MNLKLKNIVSNSLFQSAMVGTLATLLVVFVWDAPITKYNVTLNPFTRTAAGDYLWFIDDFDGDGNSERIRCFNGLNVESLDIVNYDNNGNLIEHHHFPGYDWNYLLEPKIFDTDLDGEKELFYFSTRNDSIFLSAINLVDFTYEIDHLYFNRFEKHKKNYACQSAFYEFGDFDKNGTNELFFSFDAGFGLYPRGIFKIEFPSLEIKGTKTDRMSLKNPVLVDLNADGIPEILTRTSAPDNSTASVKYSDTCSYIAVFDYDLNFLFDPIQKGGRFSSVMCIPSGKTEGFFYALKKDRSNSIEPIELMTIDNKGNILFTKKWYNIVNPENVSFFLKTIDNLPFIIIPHVGRFPLKKELTDIPDDLSKEINSININPYCFDFNNDGVSELVICNSLNEISIFNLASNETISFNLPLPIKSNIKIYPFLKNHHVKQYAFTTLDGFFLFKYYRNNRYFLLYLIYAFVFVISSVLIFLLLYLQQKRIKKHFHTEKQLSELQFNAVKNQLNPHFLFNALNSVAYMINEGRNHEAYDFLTVNSRMIQRVMNDSKEVKRPLKDEIQFTKDYISIQKHRFKDRFEFEFKIHPDVNTKLEVPKMCIHTYVENSIKHGFRGTYQGGVLKVDVRPYKKRGICITVADNGMGRKAASAYNDSSGNGINIMNEFYSLFEKYHGYKIDYSIEDNKPVGTVVELRIEEKLGR